jgi:hypothetical protein
MRAEHLSPDLTKLELFNTVRKTTEELGLTTYSLRDREGRVYFTSTLFTEPNQAPISIITFADNPSEVHVVSNAGLFIYDDATINSNSDAIVICGSREMEDETITREETIISREGKLSRTVI